MLAQPLARTNAAIFCQDEGTRRRLARDVIQTWAKTQAFLLRGLTHEAGVRLLAKHREGLLRPDYAVRVAEALRSAPREARELRAVPLHFFR